MRDRARGAEDAHRDQGGVDAVLDAADGASVLAGVVGKVDPSGGRLEGFKGDGGFVRLCPGLEARAQLVRQSAAGDASFLGEACLDDAGERQGDSGSGLVSQEADNLRGLASLRVCRRR